MVVFFLGGGVFFFNLFLFLLKNKR
jgi:hypothetical protein